MMAAGVRRAEIAGLGLVTSLGDRLDENLSGIIQGAPAFRCRTLDVFDEPIDVPYLPIRRHDDIGPRDDATFASVGLAVEQALSEAGIETADRRSMPVFIGSSSFAIGQSEALFVDALAAGDADALAVPLAVPLAGFGQVSRYLRHEHGLAGEDFLFNTACTSSANALLVAAASIEAGRCDRALVVGVELANLTTLAGFFGMQLLADECMRPFDRRRNGLVLGEGCGAIVLQAMSAGVDGLFVAGGASGCDTFSISTSNPDGSRIAVVMREALTNAGIEPGAIAAIKAHGTASPMNDDAEAAGMRQVFTDMPPIVALKSSIGHTLGACGAVETGFIVAALRTGTLPPTAGFAEYDERLGVRPQVSAGRAGPGHYMLNFFGFGGNNASVILEYQRRAD